MIQVTLPDGKILEIPSGTPAVDVLKQIHSKLAKKALAVKIDNTLLDIITPLTSNCTLEAVTYDDDAGKEIYRHSAAHLMAHAIKELYPDTKIAIGPAIENGFYYDIDPVKPLINDDLVAIEKKMREIAKRALPIQRKELSRQEALELFRGQQEDYKVELIEDLPEDAVLSIYQQGDFVDLCRGPHVPKTSKIKVFKLLNLAGAYWRGDEKNKMLQRIYATAFDTEEELNQYLNFLDEVKKRDHRRLGKDLELYMMTDEVGAGLVNWLPKGAFIRKQIEDFWREEHYKAGYDLVFSPHIGKAHLWETSGHLGFYNESMYAPIDIEGQKYYLKPMNCPFHIMTYKNRLHSYREFPIKYAELGTVYRYERSGTLHGLMRVRGFTQDDAHLICRGDQVNEEVEKLIDFSLFMLRSFGFKDFYMFLSTRPEKYVGELSDWEMAENSLRSAIEKKGIPYEVDEGGGAFYGPKIDIQIKDAIGKGWQCSTIQFDFNLPTRFDMTYSAEDGTMKRPFMVHRALLGSLERFFGTLIEHFGGYFPLWLAPVQAVIMPITDAQLDYARNVYERLREAGVRVELDSRNEKVGYKIREAETKKIRYMLVLGDKEIETQQLALREHGKGDQGTCTVEDFIARIETEVREKR